MVDLENKRQVYTIIAVVFILIIAAYFMIKSSSGDQEVLENAALANYLTFNKCVSLCPAKTFNSPVQEEQIRFYDSSCLKYCQDEYPPTQSQEAVLIEVLESKPYANQKLFDNLQECYYSVRNPSLNYTACFNRVISNYSSIRDLSQLRLEDYTSYIMKITDLNCRENSADVEVLYLSGDEKATELLISLINKDGTSKIVREAPPNIGEKKSYVIVYDSEGLTGNLSYVSLGLNLEGYALDLQELEFC